MGSDPKNIDTILSEAVEIESATERSAFLDEACGQNSQLRQRLDKLVADHFRAGSVFLEEPPTAFCATLDQPITEKPGTQIGPYKLLQQIGEGGMGVVYMAEQKEPVKRRVALKIIKPGMDTRQVIARFEAERQALAMMDHPNIAKVLDAGQTDSGRPYFVMELVNGISITHYCDEQHLTPKERLELFVPICQAVQHAHQKGIIHRDLKPSNILVPEYDHRAVPKIIDFGVAKATTQTLTEKTMFTQLGQIVGTLEYMSPEQAKRNQVDVDTRSDIYSLGVVLYELLTGETPFDRERLRSAAFDEMLRIIREEEPSKPSTKVSSSQSLPSIAANRRVEPARLGSMIRGELDWIVLKAMEKDRGRRYDTATGLSADIQSYLDDRPVLACPPSAAYRFGKFARRNKKLLTTTAVVAVALLAGTGVASWQAVRATRAAIAERQAHQQAQQAQQSEAEQRSMAEQQRKQAEANFNLARSAVDQFFTEVSQEQLLSSPGLQSLRRELLALARDFYADFVDQRTEDPKLQVELAAAQYRLGRIYGELGEFDLARELFEQAIVSYEKLLQSNGDDTAIHLGLARAYYRADEVEKAITLCEEILDVEPEHIEAKRVQADAYNALAIRDDIAAEESLELHNKSLALRRALLEEHPENPAYNAELAMVLNNIAVQVHRKKRIQEALDMFQQAAGFMDEALAHEPENIWYGSSLSLYLSNVGRCQDRLGRETEALSAFERSVSVLESFARRNPAVPELKGKLYQAYRELARYQDELGREDAASETWQLAQDFFERIPRETPTDLYSLAAVHAVLSETSFGESNEVSPADAEEVRQHQDKAIALIRRAIEAGYRDYQTLTNDESFASLRERQEFRDLEQIAKTAELARLKKDVTAHREALKEDGSDRKRMMVLAAASHALALSQQALGRYDEAENTLRESLALRHAILEAKPDDEQATSELAASYRALSTLYKQQGRWDEVIEASSSLLELTRDVPRDWFIRADARLNNRNYDEAIDDIDECLRLDPENYMAYKRRGQSYAAKGELDLAISDYTEAIRLAPKYAHLYEARALAYVKKGEFSLAVGDFDEVILRDQSKPRAYVLRAEAQLANRDYQRVIDQADELLERTRRSPPQYQNALAALSKAWEMTEQWEAGFATLSRGTQTDPQNVALWMARLELQHRKGNDEQLRATVQSVVAALEGEVEASSSQARLFKQLAERLWRAGFPSENILFLRKSSATWPRELDSTKEMLEHAHVLLMLAERIPDGTERRNCLADAETLLDSAFRQYQKNSPPNWELAGAYSRRGILAMLRNDLKSSREFALQAFKLDSANEWHHQLLSDAYLRGDEKVPADPLLAMRYSVSAIRSNPDLTYFQEACSLAADALQQALDEKEVPVLEANYLLAAGLARLGRQEAATRALRRAEEALEEEDQTLDEALSQLREEARSLVHAAEEEPSSKE